MNLYNYLPDINLPVSYYFRMKDTAGRQPLTVISTVVSVVGMLLIKMGFFKSLY